jgi:hypothetical protein
MGHAQSSSEMRRDLRILVKYCLSVLRINNTALFLFAVHLLKHGIARFPVWQGLTDRLGDAAVFALKGFEVLPATAQKVRHPFLHEIPVCK